MPKNGQHNQVIRAAGVEGTVGSFLKLLAAGMETTSVPIVPLDAALLVRIGSLVSHTPVRPDERIPADRLI